MSDEGHELEHLISGSAHALRNHVATIRSAAQLIDDDEIAESLDEASRALQVAIERAVVLSRVELGERPNVASMQVGELVALATKRARREGVADVLEATGDALDVMVTVPGPWAERLVADLLHHSQRSPIVGHVSASYADVVIGFHPRLGMSEELDAALRQLARACGGRLGELGGWPHLWLGFNEG